MASMARSGSAERERKGLHARIEKLDFELSIGDRHRLSDQLVQPLFGHCAVALLVNVNSVSRARRLSIDQHAKSHGSSRRRRAHDEMKIAGVKTVRDAAIGLVQHGGLVLHRPIAETAPIRSGATARAARTCEACPGPLRPATQSSGCARTRDNFPQTSGCANRRPLRDRGHRPTPVRGRCRSAPASASNFLNDHFRLFVCALAEMMMPNTPLRIDEIQRRPILVVEGTPYDMVVVDRDRVIDPHVLHGPAHVVRGSFQMRTPARGRRSPPVLDPCISRPRRERREACAAS